MKYFIYTITVLWSLYGFSMTDIHGEQIDKKNKQIVLTYWADWCKFCKLQVETVNSILNTEQSQEYSFVAVNYDFLSNSAQERYQEPFNFKYPMLSQESTIKLQLPKPVALPTLQIINESHEVIYSHTGNINKEDFLSLLDKPH